MSVTSTNSPASACASILLQARATATEKLLGEAREHLLARADEIREYDRRGSDLAAERDTLQQRVANLEAERIQRDSVLTEVEHERTTYIERCAALARAFTMKEAALARADESIATLNDQIAALQIELGTERQTAETTFEELNAALRREKLERAVLEGALETGRKDFARLMREVMALQRSQQAAEQPAQPRAANAA